MVGHFSKKMEAWDEEVFAGLSILLLIILILLAWWGLEARSVEVQNVAAPAHADVWQ